MKAKLTFILIVCLLIGGGVVARSAYIQLIGDPRVEELARRQFQSKVVQRPRRGSILDRNGEPLAVNIESNSLAINPSKIPNKKHLAHLLARATEQNGSKLYEKLKEKREFAWVKRHLTESDLQRLKHWHLLDPLGNMINGLWLVKESKRIYPHGALAAHVLGDVNVDSEGLEGVELWANETLQGRLVPVKAIKDALGRPTFIDSVAAQKVQDGSPVTLSLDASLQFSVEQELKNAVLRTSSKGGTVLVMNSVTGEILAMANEPSFNPNDKSGSASKRRNRAVTDGYEPGSTLKPVLLAAALSHGWHLTDRVWGERGSFQVQGKRIGEAEGHEKFEWMSLKKMIQISSNIGAAKLALRLGADHYAHTLKTFGFGSKTQLGFPGEISGKIPPRKSWQPLTLANIGFGQGILVTPIQMVQSYSVFANGGWLVQPTLLQTSLKNFTPMPPQRIFSKKINDAVIEALVSVTEEGGTGNRARLEGYQVAGKTGTAQFVDLSSKRYATGRYISTFIGFPVGVDPKVVILTLLDEPKGVYYASETTAPLFQAILNALVTRFSIPAKSPPPPHQAKLNKSPENEPVELSFAKLELQGISGEGTRLWKMPNLQQLSAREALRILKDHPFQLEIQGSGLIKNQSPGAGQVIAEKSLIRLNLAGF